MYTYVWAKGSHNNSYWNLFEGLEQYQQSQVLNVLANDLDYIPSIQMADYNHLQP